MGRRIDPDQKIIQISIGFTSEQIRFINEHRDFQLPRFCRVKLDEYIKQRSQLTNE